MGVIQNYHPTAGSDHSRRRESLGELFKDLSTDMSALVHQEVRLAQVEMVEKGKKAGLGIGMFGGAGVIGFIALETVAASAIALLATTMKVWIAALIVAGICVAIATVLALVGKEKVSEAAPPVPEQTAETLKEDLEWAKTQLQSGRK